MGSVEESLRTQRKKLEAYGKARPMVERIKQDPLIMQSLVEVVWELLADQGRYPEISRLLQDGLNYVALGIQKLETSVLEDSGNVETPRCVIAWNEKDGKHHCGICGKPGVDIEKGPTLFLEGTDSPVCSGCGESYVSKLNTLVNLLRKNPKFVAAVKDTSTETLLRRKPFDQ